MSEQPTAYRIPSVFRPPKRPEPEEKPVEEGELEGIVLTEEEVLEANNLQSGVNLGYHINDLLRNIKELEKLRRKKYSRKQHAPVVEEITSLSKKIDRDISYLVEQVPFEIPSQEVYPSPDIDDLHNLLRTGKELWSEVKHSLGGGLIGAIFGTMCAGMSLAIIPEATDNLAVQITSYMLTVPTLPALFILGGRDFVRGEADHITDLKYPSDKRKDKARKIINFMYESYVKGEVKSRVKSFVEDMRRTGANENSAIITNWLRADSFDRSLYDKLFSAYIANELGMTTTERSGRIAYLNNIFVLQDLERRVVLPQAYPETEIEDFPALIAEGERLFEDAKDERDYRDMMRAARALCKLTRVYRDNNDKLSSGEKEKLWRISYEGWGDSHYNFGESPSNNSGKSNKMLVLEEKAQQTKNLTKKRKLKEKIEKIYQSIEIPHYVPGK